MKERIAKAFRGIFSKSSKKKPATGNILGIANLIGPLVDKMVIEVFMSHSRTLMMEPVTYIVPAVWGADKGRHLNSVQEAIHGIVEPVVDEIFQTLRLKDLNEDQMFAIGFLIRGYIISKITYTIESFRNQVSSPPPGMQDETKDFMMNVKPIGSA